MDNMSSIVISITDDGLTRFLVSEDTRCFMSDGATVRRASHVEPKAYPLRVIFHALRRMFGEHGRMATFTRLWPCKWRVNLSPASGPVLPGLWRDRRKAIAAEIEWLNENFI